jgi:hypothetical protein
LRYLLSPRTRRGTNPAQHLDKSRVGAQRIVGRVNANRERVVGTFVVGFLQPGERAFTIVQAAAAALRRINLSPARPTSTVNNDQPQSNSPMQENHETRSASNK